jgi:hypothetical protein
MSASLRQHHLTATAAEVAGPQAQLRKVAFPASRRRTRGAAQSSCVLGGCAAGVRWKCRTVDLEDLVAWQDGTSAAEITAACFDAGGGAGTVPGLPRGLQTSAGGGKGPFSDCRLQSRPLKTHPTPEMHKGGGRYLIYRPPLTPARSSGAPTPWRPRRARRRQPRLRGLHCLASTRTCSWMSVFVSVASRGRLLRCAPCRQAGIVACDNFSRGIALPSPGGSSALRRASSFFLPSVADLGIETRVVLAKNSKAQSDII